MVKGASGQLLREHTQNCFLVCSFCASASATSSYATSPAESRSRKIAPQARMEFSQQAETFPTQDKYCYGRGGCLCKGFNDVQSRVGATATRARTRGSLSVRKETCFGKKTAAFSRREHTWISLHAQRDMFHRKDSAISRCNPR